MNELDLIAPMLAKSGQLPEDESRYAFEVKWDGVRALARMGPRGLRVRSRSHRDVTELFTDLDQPIGPGTLIDGEIVALSDYGHPSFHRQQSRMAPPRARALARSSPRGPVGFLAFDVLALNGRMLLDAPYHERRALLESLELVGRFSTPLNHIDGTALYDSTRRQGLEGVVAKRLDGTYEPGRRTGTWIKVRHPKLGTYVIGGVSPGVGARERTIGALLVGARDPGGELRLVGRIGTGLGDELIVELHELLEPLRRTTSPFARARVPRGTWFVEPVVACEVAFLEYGSGGTLRHPVFRRLLVDLAHAEGRC